MKLINLIKSIPFLSTFILIIFLSISNQKESTKLRLLIWNTPLLPLGTYIAISASSGYLISFLVTTNLANDNKTKVKRELTYKHNNQKEDSNLYQEPFYPTTYDNTLIERDIKDPSPTINAHFRVIGKSNRKNESLENYDLSENYTSDIAEQYDDNDYKQDVYYKNDKEFNPILDDWEDDTHLNW